MQNIPIDKIKKTTGIITGIYSEQININEPFIDFAAHFAPIPGTVILLSGGGLDCSRYNIIGAMPWMTVSGYREDITITATDQLFCFNADPFDTLRAILNAFSLEDQDSFLPVESGLFGYLSYDLKDCLEYLPRTSIDNLCLPHICLFAPSLIIVQDKINKKSRLFIPERTISGQNNLKKDLDAFKKIIVSRPAAAQSFSGNLNGFRSNFTRSDYVDAVKQIKKYIAAGHVYQVNMSQRFEMDFEGNPYNLFKNLFSNNPAPFFAYINAGNHQIVSTSPERFVTRTGTRVETRPIKGTRPRGKTVDQDKQFRCELEQSKKDEAELSMIVDLLRNDLGKVCTAGSICVAGHKRLEAYQNVYHLVSIVEGTLNKNRDSVDLLKAVFPGGSITGCPKIRAMEIIDELEPNRRHIYTGSIGYISFHNTLDLSIAIRTATIYNEKIIFSVGGGIVFDSDPEKEYDETIYKGQTLMEAFKGGKKISKNNAYVWLNGSIEPLAKARINVDDQGFLFGYGFFETIRVVKGKPKYLKEHIERFNSAWEHLFQSKTPDLTWDEIISRVVAENGLTEKISAVKIIATAGSEKKSPFNNTLLVMARPYTHRLAEKKDCGLHLATYPEPRQTPLADYKTLNYLYYLLAGKWAAANNADEALILNPDGTVSETNTANIFLIKDKTAFLPVSPHVLPGIMQKKVNGLLRKWDYKIERKKIMPEELLNNNQVFVSNSLMGTVPVLSIDGNKPVKPSQLWRKINREILNA